MPALLPDDLLNPTAFAHAVIDTRAQHIHVCTPLYVLFPLADREIYKDRENDTHNIKMRGREAQMI